MRDPSRAAHRGRRGGRGVIDQALGVAARYRNLRAEIDAEARNCGREPASVVLVGVGKKQPARAIEAAIDAGLTDLGENYLQEARQKFGLLPAVRKHFIGHLQTNKAKAIVDVFDVVQSVDRLEAGLALARAADTVAKRLPVLLQVNVSPAERFGCAPDEAAGLAEALRSQPGLRLDGIMAIGPVTPDRDAISRAFEVAAKTFGRVGGTTLSIGMSADWREAVRAGSTMVRIGTALFGGRENP
ncbi:MAG TPA: YggS family pyridoxal phosphate-dependent enzyme [Candidatus Aquilonibacter sp.]